MMSSEAQTIINNFDHQAPEFTAHNIGLIIPHCSSFQLSIESIAIYPHS